MNINQMTEEERRAYEWALNQQYQSIAARDARTLARFIQRTQAALAQLAEWETHRPGIVEGIEQAESRVKQLEEALAVYANEGMWVTYTRDGEVTHSIFIGNENGVEDGVMHEGFKFAQATLNGKVERGTFTDGHLFIITTGDEIRVEYVRANSRIGFVWGDASSWFVVVPNGESAGGLLDDNHLDGLREGLKKLAQAALKPEGESE